MSTVVDGEEDNSIFLQFTNIFFSRFFEHSNTRDFFLPLFDKKNHIYINFLTDTNCGNIEYDIEHVLFDWIFEKSHLILSYICDWRQW